MPSVFRWEPNGSGYLGSAGFAASLFVCYTTVMAEDRIDWHTGFIQALKLDFNAYSDILEIKDNVSLTAQPLEIDAVIIKKERDAVIQKRIADIFRTDNILEYKNPEVYLSIPDFEKTLAYTHLYASLQKTDIADISLTIIVSKEPKTVLDYLKSHYNAAMQKNKPGIYTITGLAFPLQMVISGELPPEENLWLGGLRSNLAMDRVETLLKESKNFDTILTKPYLSVLYRANTQTVEDIRNMSDKTFDDWLVEIGLEATAERIGEARGVKKGRKEGINELAALLEQGYSLPEAKKMLKRELVSA
jgi:hypothetical protein